MKAHLRKGLSYATSVQLSEEARSEHQWWIDHIVAWNGSVILGSALDMVIESDAC